MEEVEENFDLEYYSTNFCTDLIAKTLKKQTDAKYLHGLVRHAFSDKIPCGSYWPGWRALFHWDMLEKTKIAVYDALILFRYTFPDEMNSTGKKPPLGASAQKSGIDEFVRISEYALEGVSIFGRVGPCCLVAEPQEGVGTKITLYYEGNHDNVFEKRLLQTRVRVRLLTDLELDTKNDEELDHVFGKIQLGYIKGEEAWYPYYRFFEELEGEVDADEGGKCEHWFFQMSEVPADREDKILFYLNTLAEVVGKEAEKCMYAFSEDSFACKMSQTRAMTLWWKILSPEKVVHMGPDLRLKDKSERQYSNGMEVYPIPDQFRS